MRFHSFFSSRRTLELEFSTHLLCTKLEKGAEANACILLQVTRSFARLLCFLSPSGDKRTWGPFSSQRQVGYLEVWLRLCSRGGGLRHEVAAPHFKLPGDWLPVPDSQTQAI